MAVDGTEPSDEESIPPAAEPSEAAPSEAAKTHATKAEIREGMRERGRLVETERPRPSERQRLSDDLENRPPISSSELSRGPSDLAASTKPRVNWRVFIVAAVVIVAFSVWAMLMPDNARGTMQAVVGWISSNLGWF